MTQLASRTVLFSIHLFLLIIWADYSGNLISKDVNVFLVFGILITYIVGTISLVAHIERIIKFIKNKQ